MKHRTYNGIKAYIDTKMSNILGAFECYGIKAIETETSINLKTGKLFKGRERIVDMEIISNEINDGLFAYKRVTLPVTKICVTTINFPFGIEVPLSITTTSSLYEITMTYTYFNFNMQSLWTIADELKHRRIQGVRTPITSVSINYITTSKNIYKEE